MKDIPYVVEIVELETNKVIERIGADRGGMPQWKAERVMGGVDINLDHTRFVSRIAKLTP